MRAREVQRLDWRRKAAGHVFVAQTHGQWPCAVCASQLRTALRIILVHGAPRLRPQAKELLGRLG